MRHSISVIESCSSVRAKLRPILRLRNLWGLASPTSTHIFGPIIAAKQNSARTARLEGAVMSTGFLTQYGAEIVTLTLEHLRLTGAAMLFATAIAVPTGVWLTRSPRWAKPVIALANVLQTIPSLAMF